MDKHILLEICPVMLNVKLKRLSERCLSFLQFQLPPPEMSPALMLSSVCKLSTCRKVMRFSSPSTVCHYFKERMRINIGPRIRLGYHTGKCSQIAPSQQGFIPINQVKLPYREMLSNHTVTAGFGSN